jgi:hypothetical protein
VKNRRMSKIYVFNDKIYTEEKLMKIGFDNDGYWNGYYPGSSTIEVYELSEVIDAKEFITGLQKQRERDIQLTVLFDESEYKDMFEFISIYKESVESDEILEKNPSWKSSNSKKHEILKKFKEIGLDKYKFKNLLKREREYFLTKVNNSVEYFTAYLKINSCGLGFYKTIQTYENGGWFGKSGYVYKKVDKFKLSDETKNNFKKAKDILVELKKGVSLSNK